MKIQPTVSLSQTPTHNIACADCNRIIVRYDINDAAQVEKTRNIPHECKEQRARNRAAQRKAAR